MANYFVDPSAGDDSTGDGSALNPWKTVNKAIGSGAAASGAVTLIIAGGSIVREAVTLVVTTASGSPLVIRGDHDGTLFKAAGVSSPKVGVVGWRAWTDDVTSLSSPCLNISNAAYVTVERIKFIGGQTTSNVGTCVHATGASNLIFRDCVLACFPSSNRYSVELQSTGGAAINATFERCVFKGTVNTANNLRVRADKQAADYDLNVIIKACAFQGGATQAILESTGSGAGLAGGVSIQNCTFIDPNQTGIRIHSGDATVAGSTRATVYDSILIGGGISAGDASHVVEDGNSFTNAQRFNVNAGASTASGPVEPSLNFLDEAAGGASLRPFLEPAAQSAYLAKTAIGTTPDYDLLGRPYASPPARGCLERVDPTTPQPPAPVYIFQVEG